MALPGIFLFVVSACAASLAPATEAMRQNDAVKALSVLETLRSQCQDSSEFSEEWGLANELAGNTSEAQAGLQRAASLDPASSRVLSELGAVYLRHGRVQDATVVLDKALAVEPSNASALKYAAAAAVSSRAWEKANTLFHRLGADQHPEVLQDQPILLVWFAETLLETNQREQMERLLPPAHFQNAASFLFSLGTMLAQHGDYSVAIDYLKRISAKDADDAVYFNLGLAHSHLRQFEAARACYFQAIDKRPDHADAYFHVGLDFAADGDPHKAVPWLLHASSLGHSRPDIVFALVEQLLSLGYSKTAEDLVTEARNERIDDPLLDVAQGDVLLAGGQSRPAAELYQRALQAKPDLAAASVGLARVSVAEGDQATAQQLLEKVLSGNPDDPMANRELGLILAHESDPRAAEIHLLNVWSTDHSDSRVAIELARMYRTQNEPSKALALLQSIGSEHSDSTALHFELYNTYLALHRLAEAQREREAFTKLQASTHETLHFETPKTYIQPSVQ